MILLTLNKGQSSGYLYQQIYEEIKKFILEGKIPSNQKLLSKRKLAEQLNVSVNSVSNAYEQLLAEGYIYTIERSGYYVENITEYSKNENVLRKQLPADLREEIVDKHGWLSLSHMTADISLFPFKEWLKCQHKAINNHKGELSEIPHPQGPYIVRKTICRMIALTRGVVCEPEQIVIGAGTQPLIRQLMNMQKKHTKVLIENPGYSRIYQLLKEMEFDVHPIPLDDQGIDIQQIESARGDFLFVTPSHQFPTGKIMPISRRIELLNWAAETSDRYIVEDDYDSEFKYETDSIPSLQSLDRNQCVIYTGTFSKTMLPGIRISYMVLPPVLLREYCKHHADLMQSSNSLNLFTLHYFIDSGEYARHIKRMNHHYEMKRKTLIKQLQQRFQESILIEDIPAGLHFLTHFKTNKSYEEIEGKAKQVQLEIYSMRRFMLNDEIKDENRIDLVVGFANIQEEQIAEAVNRLYCVFH